MIKTIKLLSVAVLLLCASCNREPDAMDTSKEIVINGGNRIEVGNAGDTYTFDYDPGKEQIVSASVSPGAWWIIDCNCGTSNTLSFTVVPNYSPESRIAVVTLVCSYSDGSSASAEVGVIQSGSSNSYDMTLNPDFFTGYYLDTQYGLDGEHNYYTWLSNLPFDSNGMTQAGGTYFLFDIFSYAPEDANAPFPKCGVYTLGKPGMTDCMTFTPDRSMTVTYSDADSPETGFTEGSLIISRFEGKTVVDAVVRTTEDLLLHITYTGQADYVPNPAEETPDVPAIERDVDTTALTATASYYYHTNGIMAATLTFTDMYVYDNGQARCPGTILTVDTYMAYNKEGILPAGTYEVKTTGAADFVLRPGEMQFFLDSPMPEGSFIQDFDSNANCRWGLIDGGTMEVSGGGDMYEVVCDFTTEQGTSIRYRYSGPLPIVGVPAGFSTLTDDYTLDLTNAAGSADFYGDYYSSGGGNWYIMLLPRDNVNGDGFIADLVCEGMDFSAGIPAGTYAVSTGTTIQPGQLRPGAKEQNVLVGTMYLGDFTMSGTNLSYAPAVTGSLDISRDEDIYTLSFSFIDDLGHTWDGTWSGRIITHDISESNTPVTAAAAVKATFRAGQI